MNIQNSAIYNKIAKASQIAKKSIFLLVIFALIWQAFPRVTSHAQMADSTETAISQAITYSQEANTQKALTLEEQMIAVITEVAKQEDYNHPELAIAIARAESRFNPNIRGEQDKRDRGLFQINSHYNPDVTDECAFDPYCSAKWTIKELKAGRAWKWNASKRGWGKFYVYSK